MSELLPTYMSTIECFNLINTMIDDLEKMLNSNGNHIQISIYFSKNHPESLVDNSQKNQIDRFIYCVRDIFYTDQLDGRNTHKYQGVVCITQEIEQHVLQINKEKERFRKLLEKAKSEGSTIDDIKSEIIQKINNRKALSDLGLGRLCLKAISRKLFVTHEPILKVSYTLSTKGKSISRVTAKEARAKLKKSLEETYSESTNLELDLLKEFDDSHVFARVQKLAPHIKANIVIDSPAKNIYKTVPTSMPIMIVSNQLPAIKFWDESTINPPSRSERLDKKIEDQPFIPSLRLHKYK